MESEQTTRLDALLRAARGRIDDVDARLLLSHVLDKPPGWLFAHADAPVAAVDAGRFRGLVQRREQGEPVAYLVGTRGFWTLALAVTPDTLIPRAETELLVDAALSRLPADDAVRVADLGTGSGAIALAIARERPLAQVVATDLSKAALGVAVGNASANGIGNVWFRRGNWCEALGADRFDLIASNPPYIAEGDPHLSQGDLRHEPRQALSSGPDGLDAIRMIVAAAPKHLVPGGWLLLEHGFDQGSAVRGLLQVAGFADVSTLRDIEGRERVALGCWPADASG